MPRINVKPKVATPNKKVDKLTIHDVYILDASGSMGSKNNPSSKAYKAIEGCVENLKASFANKDVTTKALVCVFSRCHEIYFIEINDPKDATKANISKQWPEWNTALYDAIGLTIEKQLANKVKDGDAVSIKIFTDGDENDSAKYNSVQIRSIIKHKESEGWNISFVGTQYDVNEVKRRLSINDSNTLVHDNTAKGFQKSMEVTRSAMVTYTTRALAGENVSKGFYKSLK